MLFIKNRSVQAGRPIYLPAHAHTSCLHIGKRWGMVGEDERELGEEENERILGQNRCAHYIPYKIEYTDLVPCRSPPVHSLASWPPAPVPAVSIPHSTFPAPTAGCIPWIQQVVHENGPGRPRTNPPYVHACFTAANSPSGFNSTLHIPCTRCRSHSMDTAGGLREQAGSPQDHPPTCTLASRLPTLSRWFQFHAPHSLHPLQVTFHGYSGWFTRMGRVAPDSPLLCTGSLHPNSGLLETDRQGIARHDMAGDNARKE
jgi:hypothetical protein